MVVAVDTISASSIVIAFCAIGRITSGPGVVGIVGVATFCATLGCTSIATLCKPSTAIAVTTLCGTLAGTTYYVELPQ